MPIFSNDVDLIGARRLGVAGGYFYNYLKFGDAKVTVSADPDVIDVGRDLFKSEEFIDTAYKAYLDLIVDGWRPLSDTKFGIGDFITPYDQGIYVCGVERTVITHQYDPVNDVVPAQFAVWLDGSTIVLREIPRIPRQFRSAALGRHFRLMIMNKNPRTEEADVDAEVCTLMADGRIHIADSRRAVRLTGVGLVATRLIASVAINLYCDRRHLWQVQTAEPTVANMTTNLMVGVSAEHIKSLFYARTLPLTESGRKRPILHWVRAHQRRLAEGIDIDVSKHLRGVDAFEMGGFDWQITSPAKGTPCPS